jgi:hypothetical protein
MDRSEESAEFAQPWKAPRELTRALPREVRLTGRGIALNVLAVALLIGAAVAGFGLGSKATRENADRRLLDAQGIPADAVVTRLWRRSDKEEAPMATYEFTYRDNIYRHSTGAPLRVWRSLAEGSAVRIRLLPERPENNAPLDWQGDGPLPVGVAVVAAVFPAIAAAVMLGFVRRQRYLLSDGKAAMGIIRKIRPAGHGNKVMTYAYQVPGGGILTKKSSAKRKASQPGTVITVLYDPEKPTRSTIYPLELVRIDDMS